jgi:hypothetical protein
MAMRVLVFAVALVWCWPVAAQERGERHAVHSGQHGGVLLPAWNDTVHVEGVFQEQRRFRVYLTDVTGRPLPIARLRAIQGRVIDGDRTVAALVPSGDAQYLEARIGSLPMPAVITFVLQSEAGADEQIGVMFNSYSVEPPSFEVPPTVIPETRDGVVKALEVQVGDALAIVKSGAFGQVYVPATHIRELLLGLLPHVARLDADVRPRATAAIDSSLRASWLLHISGDIGTPLQTAAASSALGEAFGQLLSLFR